MMSGSKLMKLKTIGVLSSPAAAGGAWSPLDLASLVTWIDASDASTLFTDDAGTTQVSSDGDRVYSVACKNNTATISRVALGTGCIYKTNIANGNSVLRFTASNDEKLTWVFSSVSQPYTIAAAFATATGSLYLLDGYSDGARVLLQPNDFGNFVMNAGTFFNTGHTAPSAGVVSAVLAEYNGANSTSYLNGTQGNTGNAGSNAISSEYISANNNGSVEYNSDVCELIVFDAILSTDDKNNLGNYLATKWGLTWSAVS